MTVTVKLVPVGKLFVAIAVVGGIQLRGQSAAEPGDAARNLFWKLAGRDGDDDARVAVELAVTGTDLGAELKQLGVVWQRALFFQRPPGGP